MSAAHRYLPDGRLHLQHGPIDVIAGAEGPGAAAALDRAVARFGTVLEELVAELAVLRRPVAPEPCPLRGAVARRMWAACLPHAAREAVTPMAAVAGAVAEAVLGAMVAGGGVMRAYANDGGDIALHLGPGAAAYRLGLVVDPAAPASPGALVIGAGDAVRGVATSGATGRSHSRGIADSVTVLAQGAAEADVAATLIANAVDLPGHPAVRRARACDLAPDSDLGARLVTVAVGALTAREVAAALDAGEAAAREMVADGLAAGAVLVLRGRVRLVGAARLEAEMEKRKEMAWQTS